MSDWTEVLLVQRDLASWWRTNAAREYLLGYLSSMVQRDDLDAEAASMWGRQLLNIESHRVGAATPIWVSPDMMTVVESVADTFPEWPLELADLPEPQGFVVLPRTRFFVDRNNQKIGFRAFAWSMTRPSTRGRMEALIYDRDEEITGANGILVTLYSDRDEPDDEGLRAERARKNSALGKAPKWMLVHFTPWLFGRTSKPLEQITPDYDGPDFDMAITRFIQSLFALMKQEIAVVSSGRPSRGLRRWYDRQQVEVPTVKIINLRRRKYVEQDRDESEGSVIEWTHRWMVDSYWARRHTLDGTKTVLVAGHIKGPDGLPLVIKTKIERLIR